MRVVEYDSNLYPYGPCITDAGPRLAYIPELRLLSEPIPMEALELVADTMNADLRAGWGRDHIEGLVHKRVQAALELL